jgi:hypothetical protein
MGHSDQLKNYVSGKMDLTIFEIYKIPPKKMNLVFDNGLKFLFRKATLGFYGL